MKWNDPREKLPKFGVEVFVKMVELEYCSKYGLASRYYESDNREWQWLCDQRSDVQPESVIGWIYPEDIE